MKILERVQKLLSLAGNNPSHEEAEAAMLKAQEILAKNGLSMETIQPKKPSVTEVASDQLTKGQWWEQRIAVTVASNHRCKCYILSFGRKGTRVCFMGYPEDAEVAKTIYQYARDTASREASQYVKKRTKERGYADRRLSRRLRNDFLVGWVRGLEASYVQNVETKDLVVTVPEEVKETFEEKTFVKSRRPKIRMTGDVRARAQGHRSGSRFHPKPKLQ